MAHAPRSFPHQAQKWHGQALGAIVEQALVQDRQQRVQHRRVRLEHLRGAALLDTRPLQEGMPARSQQPYLVNERHARVRQVSFGLAHVQVLLQRTQRQRPK